LAKEASSVTSIKGYRKEFQSATVFERTHRKTNSTISSHLPSETLPFHFGAGENVFIL
jgi:hypothetical protein